MFKYFIIIKLILLTGLAHAEFPAEEFAARRQKLMTIVKDDIIVMKGANLVTRNDDVDYKFRQYSDFYYLTGFDEHNAALILLPQSEKFIMFVKPNNPMMAIWLGENYGLQGTKEKFKADTVISIDVFEESLREFLSEKDSVYIPEKDEDLTNIINKIVLSDSVTYPAKIKDITNYIHEMRMFKSNYEISMLQKSIDITGEAHHASMKAAKPGLMEYEIDALIRYTYFKNGCPRVGFPSIVASGPNATTLHYEDNNRKMEDGELLLLDIGAEYGMYSADVTRTIPVNGTFSDEQKAIYQIVLDAQNAGIEACKPGNGILEVHITSSDIIKEGLLKLGLITDISKRWQTSVWFMHGVSHWLGLDVHDPGAYGYREEKGRLLEPGMVLTVEPGIYISENALTNISKLYGSRVEKEEIEAFIEAVKPAFEKYKNIGVRIEDDVLITENGYRLLSKNIVKEITDIEEIMVD